MQAGKLNHRIIIQYKDSDGTTDAGWLPLISFLRDGVTVHDIAAAKKGLTGRLFYAAAAAQSENEVVYTIHYRTGIEPEMRIILDDDTENPYRITSEPVDPDDSKLWLELHVQRVDQNGGA